MPHRLEEEIRIVWEDQSLLVIAKPAGLNADRDRLNNPSAEAWAEQYLRHQKRPAPFLFHRLDRPTSGLLVFARKKSALLALQEQQAAGNMRKTYVALVPPGFQPEAGELLHHVEKDNQAHKLLVYDSPRTGKTKPARLRFRVVGCNTSLSFLEVELQTGRYHQIRAQLAHIGWPVAGDAAYGSALPFLPGAIGLHAFRLELKHPLTHLPLKLEAPLPSGWPPLK